MRRRWLVSFLAVIASIAVACGNEAELEPNVVFEANERYQTWYAWSTLSRRWDAPHMYYGPDQGEPLSRVPESDAPEILDYLYTELRLNGIEVPLVGANDGLMDPSYAAAGHDWRSHERENDNDDPTEYQSSSGEFDYWESHLDIVDGAVSRIEDRGETPVLGLRVGNAPGWINEMAELETASAEYAEWVLALLDHFEDERELEFSYVSINNEPEGNSVGADVLASRALALRARLSDRGWSTGVAGPETVTPENADVLGYLDALEANGVADDLLLVNYHSYDEDASVGLEAPIPPRERLAAFAEEHGAMIFFSEQSSDVKENRRTFWNDTSEQALQWAIDLWREMTITQMSAYCHMWNVWTNTNTNFGTDPFVLLEVGPAPDFQYLGWSKPEYTTTLGVFMEMIRPGMIRIEASTTSEDLRVVAFVNDSESEVAVVAINTGDTDVEVVLPNGTRDVAPAMGVVGLRSALP